MTITLAPTARAAEPVRVMMLGDSVTHGLSGEYTWRYFSWKGLQQTGASVDFVGPHIGTWAEGDQFGGAYANPDFDTDHAARYGLSMWETLYWNSDSAPTVTDLMAYDPDVIVETLGINDLVGVNQTPEQTVDHLREIIELARASKPGVDVVIGSLPQVWFERVPIYNAMLPALAEELSTAESRVVVTPVASWTNGVDTYDDAHPNTSGQRKLAEAVSAGLEQLGIGHSILMPDPAYVPAPEPQPEVVPESPAVETAPTVVPAPPVVVEQSPPAAPGRVRAIRHGKRVVVKWRQAAEADVYRVRCGRLATQTRGMRTVLRTDAARCSVRSVNEVGTSRWVRTRIR